MPSRSIRDQMQMRPAVTPGIRPTSPQPAVQPQIRPTAAPVRAPAVVGTAPRMPTSPPPISNLQVQPQAQSGTGSLSPQVLSGPAPTMATVSQGMNQVNQVATQPRVAVPVQQGPVGARPAASVIRSPIR